MTHKYLLSSLALVAAFSLAACGQKQPEPTSEDPDVQAQIEQDDEMKAKEEELARKEADLALREKEAELARREAELAKATSKPASRPSSGSSGSASKPSSSTTASKPAGPRTYTVASGTSISAQLPAEISTKTAKVGDRLSANLTNDLVVDGKVIARAGALLQGQVTEVVSGSQKIGGTPKLSLAFDNLTLADGSDAPVSGRLTQVSEKSDTARDTAKIAGGTVAGAVIGHQVDGDKGKVIGGLLGAAVGTIAAKKTGTEVVLPAGTVLGITLDQPINATM